MSTKICTKCKETKLVSSFFIRDKIKQTYHSQCKKCANTNRNNKDICQCGSVKYKIAKTCHNCKIKNMRTKTQKLTMGEKTYTKHLYAKYQYIRYYARQLGIEAGFSCCKKCGYDKHFEVCHIKPIASYPPETTLEEINKIDNLVPLCPNCHWELDKLHDSYESFITS